MISTHPSKSCTDRWTEFRTIAPLLILAVIVLSFWADWIFAQATSDDPASADIQAAALNSASDDERLAYLGKLIFFDTKLSTPNGQSCSTCHDPVAAFADPRGGPTSQGVLPWCFGSRNSPSAAYVAYSPPFHFDPTIRPSFTEGMYVGGVAWDGRMATLEMQAAGPFLNPLEMRNPNKLAVILGIRLSRYSSLFKQVFGPGAFRDVNRAYDYVTQAIAAYERSAEVCQFTSKYDFYLAGAAQLTDPEARGLAMFSNTAPGGAKCVYCHALSGGPNGEPLFTSFAHQNIGIPKNPDNPYYKLPRSLNPDGKNYVDRGLGAILKDPRQDGKFKIPSLRNCAVTAPFMHNGVLDTLEDAVHFINTRDVEYWPPSEVPANVYRLMPPAPGDFGRLGLTEQQEDDIVAFLTTLTDGYQP
jgi:cytochrome c peroxidase